MEGRKVSHYLVKEKLGQGGMGEVYRATDTKLNRDVALKILPQFFALDEQRMGRFEREAQVLASLNHPNIASIYGLEEANGTKALAMELVEGEDLSERISRGPIPLDEALPIALQIAEALEDAHEKSIIHRDLKPANIKLTPEGKVKVLDFGLAKALEDQRQQEDVTNSPTLSIATTRAGIILGTAAYMSPEQAKGKPVDRRADIWAFGAVLYEMLTGQKAFQGEDVTEIMAHVLTHKVDLDRFGVKIPSPIKRIIARCLERDLRRRLSSISEARIVIEDQLTGSGEESGSETILSVAEQPLWRRLVPWAGVVLFASALLITLMALWPTQSGPQSPRRLNVELGADVLLRVIHGTAAIFSPDERTLAFVGKTETGGEQLYLRRMDQLEAFPLPGTEGVSQPCFSPDGQWIAFSAGGQLKKIPAVGGTALKLCEAPRSRGIEWAEQGYIVFAANSNVGLSKISSVGGTPETLTSLEEGEVSHRWPQLLPGGRAVLFTAGTDLSDYSSANVVVQRIPNGERRVLWQGGYHARYLPSGHLVYVHEGTLFAVAFDPEKLEMAGEPTPVLESVYSDTSRALAQYSFSQKGTLIYLPGDPVDKEWTLEWLDRAGNRKPLLSQPSNLGEYRFSPDGHLLALGIRSVSQEDIWIYDWKSDTQTRFTFNDSNEEEPVWSPDGDVIVFSSNRAGVKNLYWKRANGSGETHRLTESSNIQGPMSWHPSGQYLAFEELTQRNSWDIRILTLEGDDQSGWRAGEVTSFLDTPFIEVGPAFSPDGRWLAYMSNESGNTEVYVRPFPGPGGKRQISNGGGNNPIWSPDGKELFYDQNEQIVTVSYQVEGDSFVTGKPKKWEESVLDQRAFVSSHQLHPDGQRFAVRKAVGEVSELDLDHVIFIDNFFDYLKEKILVD